MAECLRHLLSVSSNANPQMLKKVVLALRRLRFLIEESYDGENDGSSDVGLQLLQMSYMLSVICCRRLGLRGGYLTRYGAS